MTILDVLFLMRIKAEQGAFSNFNPKDFGVDYK